MAWIDYGTGAPGRNSGYSKKRWQQDYDEYLQRIEQYKGTSFYNELLNNPYMQYQEYDGNIFQQLWSDFTGNTNYIDKFYNDRKTSADEYLAQIIDAQREQAYNEPAAQLARRQAAGLNDDLNGGQNIDSGASPEVAPDDTPPDSPADNTLEVATQVASIGMNLFQSGLSLVSFFQDYAGKQIANAGADLTLTGEGYDQAIKMLAGSSSLPGTRAEYDALTEEEKAGLDDTLIQELEASLKTDNRKGMYQTRTARRLMKTLRGVVSYDSNGKPTLAYEAYRSKLLAERYGAHKQAAEAIGTPGFSEDILAFGNNIADTFGKIDLAVRQAQQKLVAAQARTAESGAAYTEQYNGTVVDGMTVAQADARAAIAGDQATVVASENAKIISDLQLSINQEFDNLRQIAQNKGGFEGMILKLLIPYAHARVMQVIQDGLIGTAAGVAGKFLAVNR